MLAKLNLKAVCAIENTLTPAMEDYLKNILALEKENRVARVSDISRRMNVKKASVVSAVRLLQGAGMLAHEKYGFITLTDKGRGEAEILKRKYAAIYNLLTNTLMISPEKAAPEACAAEHAFSADTVARLKALLKTAAKPENEKTKRRGKKKR